MINRYDGVPGRYVDIVVGVVNTTAVEWAAEHLVREFLVSHCCLWLTNARSAVSLSKPTPIRVGYTLDRRYTTNSACWWVFDRSSLPQCSLKPPFSSSKLFAQVLQREVSEPMC